MDVPRDDSPVVSRERLLAIGTGDRIAPAIVFGRRQ
jgi:hypothetical protein